MSSSPTSISASVQEAVDVDLASTLSSSMETDQPFDQVAIDLMYNFDKAFAEEVAAQQEPSDPTMDDALQTTPAEQFGLPSAEEIRAQLITAFDQIAADATMAAPVAVDRFDPSQYYVSPEIVNMDTSAT